MNIAPVSENSVLILFDQVIGPENFAAVKCATTLIEEELSDYLVDIIPSYASILITFNLLKVSGKEFRQRLHDLLKERLSNKIENDARTSQSKVLEIPVYYGPEVALDIALIAKKTKLRTEQVIHLHANKIYDVYAIGFAPGFAYLGCVDDRIAYPRKQTPRTKVPKGSLGIADQQTAIYPAESPGGWQIIGRTPLELVDFNKPSLTLFSTGDQVKFIPIDKAEFLRLGGNLTCP